MGAAFYIIVDDNDPGFDTLVNGKAVLRAQMELGRIAKASGVTPLEGFYSQDRDEVYDLLGGDEEMIPDPSDFPDAAPVAWFDAGNGLETVRALIGKISSDRELVSQPDAVLDDLGEFERVLSQAANAGLRWRLAVDL